MMFPYKLTNGFGDAVQGKKAISQCYPMIEMHLVPRNFYILGVRIRLLYVATFNQLVHRLSFLLPIGRPGFRGYGCRGKGTLLLSKAASKCCIEIPLLLSLTQQDASWLADRQPRSRVQTIPVHGSASNNTSCLYFELL